MKKVAIIGLGQFGYAVLKHLDKYNKKVNIFAYDSYKESVEHIAKKRKHLYLHTDVSIGNDPVISVNLKEIVSGADIIILSVPSNYTRESIKQLAPYMKRNVVIVNTAKALDYTSGKRLSQIISEELNGFNYHYAALAGGTIAKDLFGHEPLGIDIACKEEKVLLMLKELFEAETLNVYTTTDLEGVEYAGAFKNVISILAGIINGLGFSYGSETHLISRAAREVENICVEKYKCRRETFDISSQCWGNDLWMSCTGKTRNREFGVLIGKGMNPKLALKQMEENKKNVEGINTIKILPKICDFNDYPIMRSVYSIVIDSKEPKKTILELMKSKKV